MTKNYLSKIRLNQWKMLGLMLFLFPITLLAQSKSITGKVIAAVNVKDFHALRPIPQSQIDRTVEGSKFPQNPGY